MGRNDTWLHKTDLIDAEWYSKYIESCTWACYTIMLIGLRGFNQAEDAFTIIILFATVGIFAYKIYFNIINYNTSIMYIFLLIKL